MKTNKSIAIISNALAGGGAEKSMFALHKEFLNIGLDTSLIALNNDFATLEGKSVFVLNRHWKDGFKKTLKSYFVFNEIISKINPNIIIANCELAELYVSILRITNCRLICVEHTSRPWHQRYLMGVLVRSILRLKKVEWVTVSKNEVKVRFRNKAVRRIPNPYIQSNVGVRVKCKGPSLVFIGGLKKNKKPEWVIQAGVNNNLPVHIFGEGDLKAHLEKKYLDVQPGVKFYGFRENVWNVIPTHSLVVIASEFEGDGMVVVEAVINKCPFILAANKDLYKFEFDSKYYYQNFKELEMLVAENKKNNFKNLKPSKLMFEKMSSERSIDSVVSQWKSYLDV